MKRMRKERYKMIHTWEQTFGVPYEGEFKQDIDQYFSVCNAHGMLYDTDTQYLHYSKISDQNLYLVTAKESFDPADLASLKVEGRESFVDSTAAIGYIDGQNILLVKLSDIRGGPEHTIEVIDEYCKEIYGTQILDWTKLKSLKNSAQMKGETFSWASALPNMLAKSDATSLERAKAISNIFDYAQSGDVEILVGMDMDMGYEGVGLAAPVFDWTRELMKNEAYTNTDNAENILRTITGNLIREINEDDSVEVAEGKVANAVEAQKDVIPNQYTETWKDSIMKGLQFGAFGALTYLTSSMAGGGGNKRRTIKKHRYRRRTGKTRKARTDKKLRVNKSKQRTNKKKIKRRTNKKRKTNRK